MQKKCSEVKNRNGQQRKIIAFLKNFFLILLKSNLTLMRDDTLGTIVLIYLNGNEILQENVRKKKVLAHFNSKVNQNIKGNGIFRVVNMIHICALGPRWQYSLVVKFLALQ